MAEFWLPLTGPETVDATRKDRSSNASLQQFDREGKFPQPCSKQSLPEHFRDLVEQDMGGLKPEDTDPKRETASAFPGEHQIKQILGNLRNTDQSPVSPPEGDAVGPSGSFQPPQTRDAVDRHPTALRTSAEEVNSVNQQGAQNHPRERQDGVPPIILCSSPETSQEGGVTCQSRDLSRACPPAETSLDVSPVSRTHPGKQISLNSPDSQHEAQPIGHEAYPLGPGDRSQMSPWQGIPKRSMNLHNGLSRSRPPLNEGLQSPAAPRKSLESATPACASAASEPGCQNESHHPANPLSSRDTISALQHADQADFYTTEHVAEDHLRKESVEAHAKRRLGQLKPGSNKRKSPDLTGSPTPSALQREPHLEAARKLLRHRSQPGLPRANLRAQNSDLDAKEGPSNTGKSSQEHNGNANAAQQEPEAFGRGVNTLQVCKGKFHNIKPSFCSAGN